MTNKVVLISGGSKGLGQSLVEECLAENYKVATFSRQKNSFIENIESKYKDHFYWGAIDIGDEKSLYNFVREIIERHGDIYGLVNNVGIGSEGILTLSSSQEIAQCLNINLLSVILLTRLCTKSMFRLKQGRIINISSINAIKGNTGVSYYSAAKAGLLGFTRSLAKELGPQNVTVNSIAPGYFESDMVKGLSEEKKDRIKARTPLQRLAKPSDIAKTVKFFLSNDAGFISGQTLVVDGGLTC